MIPTVQWLKTEERRYPQARAFPTWFNFVLVQQRSNGNMMHLRDHFNEANNKIACCAILFLKCKAAKTTWLACTSWVSQKANKWQKKNTKNITNHCFQHELKEKNKKNFFCRCNTFTQLPLICASLWPCWYNETVKAYQSFESYNYFPR